MKANPSKFQAILFKCHKNEEVFDLNIGDDLIKPVSHVKLLGVLIDDNPYGERTDVAIWTTLSRSTAQFYPKAGPRHASLGPVAASNAFSCNFVNNGRRNSIQLSNRRAVWWKSHF